MPKSHINVQCTLEGPPDPFGDFANAFRMTADGSEILLDFCVYSAEENTARVVSRVRVTADFLRTMRQKIDSSFKPNLPGEVLLMPPIPGHT